MTTRWLWRYESASLYFNRRARCGSAGVACRWLPYLLQWDNVKNSLRIGFLFLVAATSRAACSPGRSVDNSATGVSFGWAGACDLRFAGTHFV